VKELIAKEKTDFLIDQGNQPSLFVLYNNWFPLVLGHPMAPAKSFCPPSSFPPFSSSLLLEAFANVSLDDFFRLEKQQKISRTSFILVIFQLDKEGKNNPFNHHIH
jgi:hypothetical protein